MKAYVESLRSRAIERIKVDPGQLKEIQETQQESGDPILSFARSGSITYTLGYPPVTGTYPVDTRGVIDDRMRPVVGNEGDVRSHAYVFESVFPAEMFKSELEHPDGRTRVFADEKPLMAMQLHGVRFAGGKIRESPTQAYADLKITCSNEVVFGKEGDPLEHYLFYFGPVPLLKDDTHDDFPNARRIVGTTSLSIFNVTDNKLLRDMKLDQGPGKKHFYVEWFLRKIMPMSYEGKTIRFQMHHECAGTSGGPSDEAILGAVSGLSVLKVKRK